jgi:hypothetical protein
MLRAVIPSLLLGSGVFSLPKPDRIVRNRIESADPQMAAHSA